jgi:exodeoxyribonuclease VII small subunit
MEEKKEMTFEEALTKLEVIVGQLEHEDIPLEKAIDYYQEGMKLSKLCDEKLTAASEKMTQMINEENEVKPFHIQEE